MREAPIDVFIVWIPAISGDDYAAATKSMNLIPDERARHYWDGSQALGEAFSPVLGIRPRIAWDVYLLFDGKTEWGETAPAPASWLHQLLGEDPARQLAEDQLEIRIRELTP
ncbi:MAG: hypothetical protein ACRD3V_02135 [Vicinamibacteria bacterium]